MKFGVSMFPTDSSISPVDLAREAEARGFESLWFPEHSHIPVSRRTPMGGVKNARPLPEHYWHSLDQFVSLAAAASVTKTIKLCTGITLVAQRDPLWLAKEVATLDLLSGGRMIFGIGYGWNKEEMASHGIEYRLRRAIVREKVAAMQKLWTEDEPSFSGRFVKFEPSWAWPKPVQKPYPPIVLGAAAGPRTLQDLASFCDGWIPLGTRHEIEGKIREVRAAVAGVGRDPVTFEVTVFYAKPDPQSLANLSAWGIDRAVFGLRSETAATTLPRLDELAALLPG
ncbi:MAG TPA: LLM class F420-dependent oxidoreductase [Acidimicrobiia bacterium]|nr:LLM class F420-dependent oxidoreductase [Acidimicrobiia bacterium]